MIDETATSVPVAASDQSRWFADEVHPHGPSLKAYLRGSFPAVRDVEDVVQEAYVRVWKARALQPIRSSRGFLFQVARRVALDILRRGRASPIEAGRDLAVLSVYTHEPDGAELTLVRERRRLLIDAIASLPRRCREIVIMRKLEEIPQREVAAALGLSERTVENLLARGVRRCEAYLREHGLSGLYDA